VQGALTRYRIIAWIVGVVLLVLVLVAVPIKYIGGNDSLVAAVGPIHGFLFMVYVVLTFDLCSSCWPARSRSCRSGPSAKSAVPGFRSGPSLHCPDSLISGQSPGHFHALIRHHCSPLSNCWETCDHSLKYLILALRKTNSPISWCGWSGPQPHPPVALGQRRRVTAAVTDGVLPRAAIAAGAPSRGTTEQHPG
jgi:integral membrane protein